ncbi:conserved hypothetical protein [uncultured Paludibacter sp.]|nr:conserved hypothetical protein [uncultured Paludibacter sp.]
MQQIIVIIIGVFVFGYLIYHIYKIITKKTTDTKCGSCSGCEVDLPKAENKKPVIKN